jgi:hypothetical protein
VPLRVGSARRLELAAASVKSICSRKARSECVSLSVKRCLRFLTVGHELPGSSELQLRFALCAPQPSLVDFPALDAKATIHIHPGAYVSEISSVGEDRL